MPGLGLFGAQRVVDDHDVQALARLGAADMLFHQMRGQMCRTRPARAGQPVAVDDEDLVRDRLQPVELLQEVGVVEPADAAAIAIHQPGTVQDEGAGADTDQRHLRRRRASADSACIPG